MKITKTAFKKTTFTLLMFLSPMLAFAEGDAVAENFLNAFTEIVNKVGLLIIVVVVAFGAIQYMTKKKDDRSGEDGEILKGMLLKVLVGTSILLGATNIANWVWDLLS